MKTHRWLRHVIVRTSGSVGSAPRESSAGTVRAWVTSGILVLALVLGSLGIAASASPGHGSTGHIQASAQQLADSSGHAGKLPWMY